MKLVRIVLPLFLGITQICHSQWIVFNQNNTKGIEGTLISSGFEASDDKLWFGTDHGAVCTPYAQIFVFDGESWKTDNTLAGGYYYINDMSFDPGGSIWQATTDGIIKYKDSDVQVYFNNPEEQNNITFIKADNHGQIWAGRYDYGLLLYSGGSWSGISRSDGLSSNYLKDILFDSRGRTWILADNGINRSSDFTIIDEPSPVSGEKIAVVPNPFSGTFVIKCSARTEGFADIRFFGADGRLIKLFHQQKIHMGDNTLPFESESWPDGLLFCTIFMPGFSENIKLLKVYTH